MSSESPDAETPTPRRGPKRYPGWLLIVLGGAAGGAFGGWWGLAFGAALGLVIWQAR